MISLFFTQGFTAWSSVERYDWLKELRFMQRKLGGPPIYLVHDRSHPHPPYLLRRSSNMRYRFVSLPPSCRSVSILLLLTYLPLIFSVCRFQKPAVHIRPPNPKHSFMSLHPPPSELMEGKCAVSCSSILVM
ncbi:hypothetical protein BDQ12DRAFT_155103 [Crucibulum laeve]|uniref:Uncharacterized protein n=1 Tax=Crucibulum laeve TaxID=68775 RepID=A0A5C3LRH5_9AGAR|nr:hypothetical protein BDQ12DRAFT_155103 [Crucibulum laeve]